MKWIAIGFLVASAIYAVVKRLQWLAGRLKDGG